MGNRELDDFTLFDPAVQADPYGYYALMHESHAVHYDRPADLYLVAHHDLLQEAAAKPAVFSSEIDMRTDVGGPDTTESEALFKERGWVVRDVLSQADPPRHTQFRGIVERLFTGPIVRKMHADIEQRVDDLIDGFWDRGKVDFLAEFAVPLPLGVIADQLGVPRNDMALFKTWSDAIIDTLGIMLSAERRLECTHQIIEFQHYFVDVMESRRHSPREDIISLIAQAELDDRALTTEERLALVQQILVAGNETTRNHLAKCALLLAQHPKLQQRVRSEPTLTGNFVEETLRLESPVQGLFRRVTQETRLGDTVLPEGAKVMLVFGAANRDPEAFPQPGELDVERKNARRHVAFSHGIHSCIGAMLARSELRVSVTRLLERLNNIALQKDFEPEHAPSVILRGLTALHLTFEPIGGS